MSFLKPYSFLPSRTCFSVGLLLAIFSSCNPEENSAPPQIISVITTGQDHGDGAHAIAGKSSNIKIIARDDLGLKEIRCTYSGSGEYHSHALHGGGLIPAFRAPNIGEWAESRSRVIDSIYNESTLKFAIPETLSGVWKLTTAAMDIEGNVTYHEMDVIIENDSIPAMLPVSTEPEANADGIIELAPGENFTASGNILDENYLESIEVAIRKDGLVFWTDTTFPENEWMYNMSQIEFPTFSEPGSYDLTITVIDRHGWKNWMFATIVVRSDE
jgi:hypothetical protein